MLFSCLTFLCFLSLHLVFQSVTNSTGIFSDISIHEFGVFNLKLRYDFRLQSLGYILYVTVELVTMITENYWIWDSELVKNIRLRELQPCHLRAFFYVLFESFLHVLYDCTLLSSFCSFFFFLSFLFFLVFFLCCLLMFTRFQFYLLLCPKLFFLFWPFLHFSPFLFKNIIRFFTYF